MQVTQCSHTGSNIYTQLQERMHELPRREANTLKAAKQRATITSVTSLEPQETEHIKQVASTLQPTNFCTSSASHNSSQAPNPGPSTCAVQPDPGAALTRGAAWPLTSRPQPAAPLYCSRPDMAVLITCCSLVNAAHRHTCMHTPLLSSCHTNTQLCVAHTLCWARNTTVLLASLQSYTHTGCLLSLEASAEPKTPGFAPHFCSGPEGMLALQAAK